MSLPIPSQLTKGIFEVHSTKPSPFHTTIEECPSSKGIRTDTGDDSE